MKIGPWAGVVVVCVALGCRKEEETASAMLQRACKENNSTLARQAISKGADVNQADPAGWTPILEASTDGSLVVMRLLVSKRAQIDVRSSGGMTPLMEAVVNGHADCAKELLKDGASTKARTRGGMNVFAYAKDSRNPEIVAMFKGKS